MSPQQQWAMNSESDFFSDTADLVFSEPGSPQPLQISCKLIHMSTISSLEAGREYLMFCFNRRHSNTCISKILTGSIETSASLLKSGHLSAGFLKSLMALHLDASLS